MEGTAEVESNLKNLLRVMGEKIGSLMILTGKTCRFVPKSLFRTPGVVEGGVGVEVFDLWCLRSWNREFR